MLINSSNNRGILVPTLLKIDKFLEVDHLKWHLIEITNITLMMRGPSVVNQDKFKTLAIMNLTSKTLNKCS